MCMAISIRVTDYTGDLETLRDVYLIGPFATPGARDSEISRLYQLPGVYGAFDFAASGLDPASGADAVITADAAAAIRNADDLADAL